MTLFLNNIDLNAVINQIEKLKLKKKEKKEKKENRKKLDEKQTGKIN